MANDSKQNAHRREAILRLLSAAEVAKVSRAEDAPALIEGDQYVDLTNPGAGIQLVQALSRTPPGHALPRSAVSEATWSKIVQVIAT